MNKQPDDTVSPSSRSDVTTVADLMKPPIGVFTGDMTVAETVEQLRDLTRAALITYCYVTDEAGRLEGVVVMRDLLLASPDAKLSELMLRNPFALDESMNLKDALKAALSRHSQPGEPAQRRVVQPPRARID